jgi:hypothetical protein
MTEGGMLGSWRGGIEARETSSQTSVFWIHANNPNKFKQGYDAIANEINIPGADDPGASTLSLVKTWVTEQDCGQWLMIIDNADNGNMFFGPSAASPQRIEAEFGT